MRWWIVGAGSIVTLVACSEGDAIPSSSTSARSATQQAVVTAEEIPADIFEDSWARLPLPRRELLSPDGQRAYDVIVNPDSRYASGLRGPLAMWVYSPVMTDHMFPASTYLRYGTEKDQRLTELVILTTARELRSQYEWTSHEPLADQAGLEREIIDLVKRRGDPDTVGELPGLGPLERTIVAFVREVISEERVSSETFSRALDLLGEQGVMELAGLVGYYAFVDITLKTFDVQVAPGDERLLPDLW